jgi:hypothetical protein
LSEELLSAAIASRQVSEKALREMSEAEFHSWGIARLSVERIRAKTYGLKNSILKEENSYRFLKGNLMVTA